MGRQSPIEAMERRTLFSAQPLGDPFRLQAAEEHRQYVNLACDDLGNFVTVIESGSGSVYFRRFDNTGRALGGELYPGTRAANAWSEGAVAMDADGDFVVTWTGNDKGTSYGVFARVYDRNGVAKGNPFLVNTVIAGNQVGSSVAMDDAGNFVVTWASSGQVAGGTSYWGRRFNAAGQALGGEFRLNSDLTTRAFKTEVAMDADGDFVFCWSYTITSSLTSGQYPGAWARRFDKNGVAQGAATLVSDTTSGTGIIDVAMDDAGNFVAAYPVGYPLTAGTGVYVRRYAADGTARDAAPVLVDGGDAFLPSVSASDSGSFVVAWQKRSPDGTRDGISRIFAEEYDGAGVAQRAPTQVSPEDGRTNGGACVAMDADGDYVVGWESILRSADGTTTLDHDLMGRVFKQQPATSLFGDVALDPLAG